MPWRRSRRFSSAHWVRKRGRSSPKQPGPDTRVAIGLGSNVGDRLGYLAGAVDSLAGEGDVVARSSLWETAPIGPEQPDFLNAVVVLDTVLGPCPLLERCLDVEREAGRERRERWGPRTLDLDLLLYGDAVIDGDGLSVPHPRIAERRFVLAPLAEAWPGVLVPGHGPVEGLLPAVAGQEAVRTELEW